MKKGSASTPSSPTRLWASESIEHEIHTRISERTTQRKHNPTLPLWNCSTLGKDLEYTRQTITVHIERMIAKGYPIAREAGTHGLYYTQSFTPVLAQVITESGMTRLFLAVRAIEALKDSPIFAPVLADLQKLIDAQLARLGLDYAALSSCITIKNTGIDPFVDPGILEQLITAIRERQELEIVYSKLNHPNLEGECPHEPPGIPTTTLTPETIPHPNAPWLPLPVETRIAHPLHILCLDNVWYLYLWDPLRKDIRRFMLSRMHSVTRTGKPFRPRKFNVKPYIDHLLGVTGGDPVKVRVQFRGKASYLVAERPWHHTQEIAPGPDEEWNLELTIEVAHTPELERQLMGYDQDFRVLEPVELKQAIDRKVDGMFAVRRSNG